jgi:checkpoint serine/threonine-protein kinase
MLQLGKPFPEPLAVYYAIRMLRSIERIHAANVLHGDIKPDNWLIASGRPDPELASKIEFRVRQYECDAGDLCLIDFGRAIDLSAYPPGTRFVGDCHTKGFQCVEMLSSRPWTFQIDTFGFLGTIHCMLFGDYMKVRCQKIRGVPARWAISKPFKRYWQVDMWTEIFDELLNIRSCSEQPSLTKLRLRLEDYLRYDRRRRQVCVCVIMMMLLRSTTEQVVMIECARNCAINWPSRSDC